MKYLSTNTTVIGTDRPRL